MVSLRLSSNKGWLRREVVSFVFRTPWNAEEIDVCTVEFDPQ